MDQNEKNKRHIAKANRNGIIFTQVKVHEDDKSELKEFANNLLEPRKAEMKRNEARLEAMQAAWKLDHAGISPDVMPDPNASYIAAWNSCWLIVDEKDAMIELLESSEDGYRGG